MTRIKKPLKKPFNGAALKPGNPGNSGGKKGRSGRKTLEFKVECERLADDEVLPKMQTYLSTKSPDDPSWRWCADKVLEYSKAKAPQVQKHVGADGNPLQPTHIHVHLGDNGRGISPPTRTAIANGNGAS